jgi:hypothetical protein
MEWIIKIKIKFKFQIYSLIYAWYDLKTIFLLKPLKLKIHLNIYTIEEFYKHPFVLVPVHMFGWMK